jgi:transposase
MIPTDTWKFMKQKDGVINCSRTLVFEWHKRFREGRADIEDNARGGRPANDARSVKKIKDVLATDRRKSPDDIADTVGQSWNCP